MIRRWSCIIELNNNFSKVSSFSKIHKISVFKSSVKFKRFTFRLTKFKRKSLIRFKHRSNWLIYTNVLKFWTKDYMFNKNYFKYQYINQILPNMFLFYNFNFIKNRSETLFYNFNFIFNTFTRKSYNYFHNFKFNYIQNSPITFGFSSTQPSFNTSTLSVYSQIENSLIPYSFEKNYHFDILLINELILDIIFKKTTEFRKILTYLFLNNIHKY